MSESFFDVIVLGGGAGGFPAAVRAAQLGGKVAVVEERDFGGLCMNRGCVPFSHMAAATGILEGFSLAQEMGLNVSKGKQDFAALMKRQNSLIDFMRQGVQGMLRKNKVEVIRGRGKPAGKGTIEVNGKSLNYHKLILATGAKWVKPDFSENDLKDVITSDNILESDTLPERILLFGSSPWLIEIAQFLHNFGTKAILVTDEKSILPLESKTIRSRLLKILKKQGIEVKTKTRLLGIKKKKDGLHVSIQIKDKKETVLVDRVLTLKRKAELSGLGLSTVGLNEKGEYLETDNRMQTKAEGIYAIGDLAAMENNHFSHAASTGGIIAAENAMGRKRVFDPNTITRVLFSKPQAACIGLTAKQAKKAGYDVITGTAPLSMNPYGMILSQTEGIAEIVAEKKYSEILGVHIIGENAVEMAGIGSLAIQMEMTLDELARSTFPHPTLSESLTEAAREALGQQIYIP